MKDDILIAGIIGGAGLWFAIDSILTTPSKIQPPSSKNIIHGADGLGPMWVKTGSS